MNTQKRTPGQNKRIHLLLNRTGLMKYKRDLVYSVSNGRTGHSSELTRGEAKALLQHLNNMMDHRVDNDVRADKMRKKILSMAHEMGWERDNGYADLHRINRWCKKHGYLHKPLNEHTYEELPKLVTQFEQVYTHYLTKIR